MAYGETTNVVLVIVVFVVLSSLCLVLRSGESSYDRTTYAI
jgi:hypothetical protein